VVISASFFIVFSVLAKRLAGKSIPENKIFFVEWDVTMIAICCTTVQAIAFEKACNLVVDQCI